MPTVLEEDVVDERGSDVPPADDSSGRGDGDGGDQDEPWVTIRAFWEPVRAHLAQVRLDDAEIESVLLDENVVATDWLMANAVGGIKLKVRASQAAQADEVLRAHRVNRESWEKPALVDPEAKVVCPRCGASDVYQNVVWRKLMIVLLLAATVASLGLLLFFVLPWLVAGPRRWTCLHCGWEWVAEGRGFEVGK
ncbi:MAG TPA: hypothetical protein VF669_08245 [Tepidisphaeraceae bacterium]|jgi:hypothetical protein